MAFYIRSLESGEILHVSPNLETLVGVRPADVLGEPARWRQSIHPDDRERAGQEILESLARGREYSVEYRMKSPSGAEVWVRDEGRAHERERKAPILLGFVLDVTGRRRLEERVLEAEKTRTLGLLAGGIAHDFGNVLTVIRGFSDLALANLLNDSPSRPAVREILRAAERGTSLTHRLMILARRRSPVPVPTAVNEIVADLQEVLLRLLGENVQIELRLAPDTGSVLIDPGEAWQVLLNLAMNARDAMPNGGKLTIETSIPPAEPDSPPRVRISVVDTGVGIGPDTMGRVFEPFFSTKDPGSGTGLGLATVQNIVQSHGGCVEVKSAPGCGTTVNVVLPRFADAVEAMPAGPIIGVPARATETVLLVEDEAEVRNFVRAALADLGYFVLDAESVDGAIEIAETFGADIHVLVTDVILPKWTGIELARRVQALRPDCSAVFMSGYPLEALRDVGLDEKDPFLQKPFTLERLSEMVRSVLGGRSNREQRCLDSHS